MKISQLKDKVANARIIDDSKLNTHTVQILNRVKIRNTKNNMTMEYTIVTESEANLKEGKIASSTPIAQGLLGKKDRRHRRNKSSFGNHDFRNRQHFYLKNYE